MATIYTFPAISVGTHLDSFNNSGHSILRLVNVEPAFFNE